MIRRIKKTTLKFTVSAFMTVILMACTNNNVFFAYHSIPLKGWNMDSIYNFNIPIKDTSIAYNIYVNVRNRSEYQHQNLWLFIQSTSPDHIQKKDTINFFLADQRGKWLGSGLGSMYEMPVLYLQHFHFSKVGIYRFGIVQGMRDTILVGINDIGMRIEKCSRK